MKSRKTITAFFLLFFFGSVIFPAGYIYGKDASNKPKYTRSKDGLGALMELSSGRADMLDELKDESAVYKKVSEAIGKGALNVGDDASVIKKKIGEPVVSFYDEKTGVSEWIYKPYTSDFFSKEKIYLYFDAGNKLTSWKVPETPQDAVASDANGTE